MKLNIPNLLSIGRILLIPWFLRLFLGAVSQREFTAAAAVLAVSGLTDTLDGALARRLNMVTQLGKILDPLADKLTLAAVIAALWIKKPELWLLYALLLVKEVLMLLGGLRLHLQKVTIEGSRWFGKLATVLFYVIMIVIVAYPALNDSAILGLLICLLVFMLFAFLQYARLFKKMQANRQSNA